MRKSLVQTKSVLTGNFTKTALGAVRTLSLTVVIIGTPRGAAAGSE
jgi:hypothetical protein